MPKPCPLCHTYVDTLVKVPSVLPTKACKVCRSRLLNGQQLNRIHKLSRLSWLALQADLTVKLATAYGRSFLRKHLHG